VTADPVRTDLRRRPSDAWPEVVDRVYAGERFAGMVADDCAEGIRLTVLLAGDESIEPLDAWLPHGSVAYPALTPLLPAAAWYERAIHDLHGLRPEGHPRLLPLQRDDAVASEPRLVSGYGVFAIPHGPVRSGVTETIQYLVETPGEDIPRLSIRPQFKHRGIQARFTGLPVDDGALLAERVEGVASVAHALAYCHAVEQLAGVEVPSRARLVRALYAELERIANHLDVALRLADAAGLAVATARFGWHKENVLRLVSRLSGSRFGRGVVVPGGVRLAPAAAAMPALLDELDRMEGELAGDVRALMALPSFLDRIRGTGPLSLQLAVRHGALGPVGRASGVSDDNRINRPYDAYPTLGTRSVPASTVGDAMARLRVRWAEVDGAFHLLRQVAEELSVEPDGPLRVDVRVPDGRGIGWAEAPQGEVLYTVRVSQGRVARCAPRSASFHNLTLFHDVFVGDILTDFPFIEASFGLSVAGVSL
jgi:Ni,Fe-hydrogenase III large subunit